MSLEMYLSELASSRAHVKSAELIRLSSLTPEEQIEFREGWESLTVQKRRELITKMVELAEENVEMEFLPIFASCMVDEDPVVRERSISGLWESDDRAIITPLIERLSMDSEASVREAAALALGRFAELAQVGKLLSRDAISVRDALIQSLRNEAEGIDVRRRALEGVAPFGLPEVKKWVIWAYKSSDQALRQSAVFAMGKSADQIWIETIKQELESNQPAMRYEAANACREFGDEELVPYLGFRLNDQDQQVQIATIHALGSIGGEVARNLLRENINSDDQSIQDAVDLALELIEIGENPTFVRPNF